MGKERNCRFLFKKRRFHFPRHRYERSLTGLGANGRVHKRGIYNLRNPKRSFYFISSFLRIFVLVRSQKSQRKQSALNPPKPVSSLPIPL